MEKVLTGQRVNKVDKNKFRIVMQIAGFALGSRQGCKLVVFVWCRFNGQDFLVRFTGKKIMFVGDSLSRNQWLSLACMLRAAVPQSIYAIQKKGDLSNFTLQVGFFVLLFHSLLLLIRFLHIYLVYRYMRNNGLMKRLRFCQKREWLEYRTRGNKR